MWNTLADTVVKVANVTESAYSYSVVFGGMADLSRTRGTLVITDIDLAPGVTTAMQMLSGCTVPESIFATSFTNAISSASMMFYSCPRLVGGTDGFVPSNTSGATVCKLGTGGVLTNPSSDIREWCKVYVYSDGSVVFTASGAVNPNKTLLASGRMCVSAKYNATGVIPGYANVGPETGRRQAMTGASASWESCHARHSRHSQRSEWLIGFSLTSIR